MDLFGGTGQLGIEALSRGAEHCTFVDQRSDAAALIRDNLKVTDFRIGPGGPGGRLGFSAGCREQFDVIFLDPPYQSRPAGAGGGGHRCSLTFFGNMV
ncbi:MAG: RsmD family RNA methyltransferase [Lawsonibacter sp.]